MSIYMYIIYAYGREWHISENHKQRERARLCGMSICKQDAHYSLIAIINFRECRVCMCVCVWWLSIRPLLSLVCR